MNFLKVIVAVGLMGCGTDIGSDLPPEPEETVEGALGATSACVRSAAPIEESFRIMLGRNPTSSEIALHARMMVSGLQVAYFEPYARPLTQRSTVCATWSGSVTDTRFAGIPYNTTVSPERSSTTAQEWTAAGANLSQFIAASVRTFQCRLPTAQDITSLNRVYQRARDAATALGGTTAQANAKGYAAVRDTVQAHSARTPCLDVLNDIARRILGREVDPALLNSCVLDPMRRPATLTSDCDFIWELRFGTPAPGLVNELIHASRSTREAVTRNSPDSCLASVGSQTPQNLHALGEYVAQLYRLLLGRIPGEAEIESMVARTRYTSGSTTSALKFVVQRLVNSAEYQRKTVCLVEVPL